MLKKLCLGLMGAGLFCFTSLASGGDSVMQVYESGRLRVSFPADGYAVQPLPARPLQPGYFGTYSRHLKFCRQPELPPHMQQVRSEDGWLCHFYVLPPLSADKAKAEILKTGSETASITYQKQPGIGEERFRQQAMLVWRKQMGKTRLDHFLVIGPEYNVLFVSSPYGDGERIREIVETLEFN